MLLKIRAMDYTEGQRLAKEFGENALCYQVAGYPEDLKAITPFLELARNIPKDDHIYVFVEGEFNGLPAPTLQVLLAQFEQNLKQTESWWAERDSLEEYAMYWFFSERYKAMIADVQAGLLSSITA